MNTVKIEKNEHFKKSGFVALMGRPNVGKSTLLNSIIGENLSIVSPKAQTTRERVQGIFTDPENGQIIFTDTPGIHQAKIGGINEFMVKSAALALEDVDVIWYILDPYSKQEFEVCVFENFKDKKIPIFIILNKLDLLKTKEQYDQSHEFLAGIQKSLSEKGFENITSFEICATQPKSLEPLLLKTWGMLPVGPLYYPESDELSNRPLKFFIGEFIRKKIFDFFEDEIPYSCAVKIEKYQARKNGMIYVEALIFMERDSQKGIIIGQGGKSIKKLGEASRKDIEKFTGKKIFLDLKVQVLKDWTKNPKTLIDLGYVL